MIQPGESRDFTARVPAGEEVKRLHAVIHFEPFDSPILVLSFFGANLAFGWVFGSLLAALV